MVVDMDMLLFLNWLAMGMPKRPLKSIAPTESVSGATALSGYSNSNNPRCGTDLLRGAS
jgi:hypothetical protein